MKVSVIIPFYNSESTIVETLESLESQSFKDWVLIAVNDGSTDSSEHFVKKFADANPGKVVCVKIRNGGPSRARNVGIRMAKTTFVAFLDSDDVWHPDKLGTQMNWLSTNPQALACTSAYQSFTPFSSKKGPIFNFNWTDEMLTKWSLLEGSGPCLCSTLMIRKDVLTALGGFDETMENAEDTEFSLRLASMGMVGSIGEVMMYYRVSSNQGHRNPNTILWGMEQVLANELFEGNESIKLRARCNALTLMSCRQYLNFEIMHGSSSLLRAFKIEVFGPIRYLSVTVSRKLKSRISSK